jgi:hypothetical protein
MNISYFTEKQGQKTTRVSRYLANRLSPASNSRTDTADIAGLSLP